MTRCVIAVSCGLISLFALAAPVFGQGYTGSGILGTPPPEGHVIEEVATAEENGILTLQPLYPGETTSFEIELPLPVFPSSGLPAEPSQCMWSLERYHWYSMTGSYELQGMLYIQYVNGNTLTILVTPSFPAGQAVTLLMQYQVTAVAIRTAPPAPVESRSFGEIKAMFRKE